MDRLRGCRRLLCLTMLAASGAAVAAGQATAATTVGQNVAPSSDVGCNADTTYIQTRVASGNPYVVPFQGVITSWTAFGGMQPARTRLKVFRPATSALEFRTVGESPIVHPPLLSASAFPVRIPVLAGDHLGHYFLDQGSCSLRTRADGDRYVYATGDVPLHTVRTFEDEVGASGTRESLSAQLEPDLDRDGFGDETQDRCPTNVAIQGPCAPVILPDKTRPVLGTLRLARKRFRAAASGPSISAAKVGTTASYGLSEAGTVTFTVEKAAKGKRVGRRCVSPRRSNRKRRSCTRYVAVRGSFAHTGKAGQNRFRFRGRWRGRKLRPGRYRLRAQARDLARNKSGVRRTPFRIVRR